MRAELDKLTSIDAVLLSHDHYDHLDSGSIRILKDKVSRFIAPLGLKKRLVKWGVDSAKITENAWGETLVCAGLKLVCGPA